MPFWRSCLLTNTLQEYFMKEDKTVAPDSPQAREADLTAATGSLVHEIKNPLSTLSINAQLLLEEWRDAASQKELRTVKRLEVMALEVERLERIIESFLRFTERHELNLRETSLNQCLEQLVDFVSNQIAQKGIELRLWLDPALEPFPFDSDLIRQVFLNLVINAENAMGEEGGELILRSRRVEENGRLWAVGDVVDTGRGIPPRVRERIFQLYFSTTQGGQGLGLATSKRITEEHGGFIRVESEPGKGSQFSVYLPMVRELVDDSTSKAEASGS